MNKNYKLENDIDIDKLSRDIYNFSRKHWRTLIWVNKLIMIIVILDIPATVIQMSIYHWSYIKVFLVYLLLCMALYVSVIPMIRCGNYMDKKLVAEISKNIPNFNKIINYKKRQEYLEKLIKNINATINRNIEYKNKTLKYIYIFVGVFVLLVVNQIFAKLDLVTAVTAFSIIFLIGIIIISIVRSDQDNWDLFFVKNINLYSNAIQELNCLKSYYNKHKE